MLSTRKIIVTLKVTAFALVVVSFLVSNAKAENYYVEPPETAPHAKLAYMAKETHVLVGAIDGNAVFGDKPPQRLMALEGAASDKYVRIAPGTHKLLLRVFFQELLGSKEMSEVSALDVEFINGRIYYPLADKISLGGGKVKATYTIAEADSDANLKATLADRAQKGSGDLAVSNKRLPEYTAELIGEREVRVTNPNGFAVLAGLRSESKGSNFTVPANGQRSTYVPDGHYDIYFVYSNKPDALFQGDSFTINGGGIEIKIVKVVGGNYGIRQVK